MDSEPVPQCVEVGSMLISQVLVVSNVV
jgi:hypothetical protein